MRCSKTFRVFKAAFALEVVIRGLARLEDPELLPGRLLRSESCAGELWGHLLAERGPKRPALAVGLELHEHGPHPGSCCDV